MTKYLDNIRNRTLTYGNGEVDYEAVMTTPPFEEPQDSSWELQELREAVAQHVDNLDPRELWIVNAYISEGKSLQKIANELGMTKTHVWRLRNQAFDKLRAAMSADTTIRKRVTMATTWEDSAAQWMLAISDTEGQRPASIGYMEDVIEYMRRSVMSDELPRPDSFLVLARRCALLSRELESWDSGELLSLVISKQRDYGHGNINSFGIIGIVVRLSDKIERYKNLMLKKREPSNESIIDTVHDIIGYCLIALMFLDETFQLELGE